MRFLLPIAALIPAVGCALPDADFDEDGWDAASGDCDDADPSVHPGASDPFGDRVDQDCDGVNPQMMARGQDHDCLLDARGWIVCEGDNQRHQLEVPDSTEGRIFVQIVAGYWHTCALDVDGLVVCWGDDQYGQASPPADAVFDSILADSNYSVGRSGYDSLCWGACPIQR